MTTTLIETVQQADSLVGKYTPKVQDGLENFAFVLREKGQFCYERRPVPTLPSNRHVIVAIKATGLCGSDVRTSPESHLGVLPLTCPDPLLAAWGNWQLQGSATTCVGP